MQDESDTGQLPSCVAKIEHGLFALPAITKAIQRAGFGVAS